MLAYQVHRDLSRKYNFGFARRGFQMLDRDIKPLADRPLDDLYLVKGREVAWLRLFEDNVDRF